MNIESGHRKCINSFLGKPTTFAVCWYEFEPRSEPNERQPGFGLKPFDTLSVTHSLDGAMDACWSKNAKKVTFSKFHPKNQVYFSLIS